MNGTAVRMASGMLAALVAMYPSHAAGDGLTAQYQRLLAKKPPSVADIGVDTMPGAVLRVNQSAQLMAANFPQNKPGQSPAVYALEYFVPNGDYRVVVDFYKKFSDPGAAPVETGHGTHSLRTVIPLAPNGPVKQRIVVAPSFTGVGCTTSWNEDYSARCVTVYVVSQGADSWAKYGRR